MVTSQGASSARLIVFGRYPVPGQTKTRLIPVLGPAGAADFQHHLTEKTLLKAQGFTHTNRVALSFCVNGGDAQKIRRWMGKGFVVNGQSAGDLGCRMRSAIFDSFRAGCERVVLVGTDIPDLSAEIFERAFSALSSHDMVFGPSTDGGYWLVGMRRPVDVFREIKWGTSEVLNQTLSLVQKTGLSVHLLDPLSDVDTPEDLRKSGYESRFKGPFLSVVIPVLNEAFHIGRTIKCATDTDAEIIVSDGGSRDRTLSVAEGLGVQVITGAKGRAWQQNLGAKHARGRVLLFLHADTRLPKGYVMEVFDALLGPGFRVGAFRFKTDFSHPLMHLVEWITALRARFLHLPYGDQALFMKKKHFDTLGGFPTVPIGEDLLLVRKCLKNGRVVLTNTPAITSGRRWKKLGPLKTTWINQLMLVGMAMGISLRTLARLYHSSPDTAKRNSRGFS